MERLKEDYKGDILDVSMNGRRQYEEVENANGTKSMIDRTVYAQLGDEFGPEDFNNTNKSVNELKDNLNTFHYRNIDGQRQVSDDGVNWANFSSTTPIEAFLMDWCGGSVKYGDQQLINQNGKIDYFQITSNTTKAMNGEYLDISFGQNTLIVKALKNCKAVVVGTNNAIMSVSEYNPDDVIHTCKIGNYDYPNNVNFASIFIGVFE